MITPDAFSCGNTSTVTSKEKSPEILKYSIPGAIPAHEPFRNVPCELPLILAGSTVTKILSPTTTFANLDASVI